MSIAAIADLLGPAGTPDPRSLSNKELADFVIGAVTGPAHSIAELLKGFEPYFFELRWRFRELRSKPGETILGCSTWNRFCNKHLRRTRRAVNYWLSGGNPLSKRFRDSMPWETVSRLRLARQCANSPTALATKAEIDWEKYGRQINVFYNGPEYREFRQLAAMLREHKGSKNLSELLLELLRQAVVAVGLRCPGTPGSVHV